MILPLALFALTACEKDEGKDPDVPETHIISFESLKDFTGATAQLEKVVVTGLYSGGEHDNVFWGKRYAAESKFDFGNGYTADSKIYSGWLFSDADGLARFSSYYDSGEQWGWGEMDTWYGFVVSQNHLQNPDFTDYPQFSVWAGSGANGTSTFAVAYRYVPFEGDTTVMSSYATPTIEFAKPCTVKSFWVANSPLVYTYTAGTSVLTLTVTAYLDGVETGSRSITLLDEEKGIRIGDWTKVECGFDGKADRLVFMADGNSDFMPTYFCLDEIEIEY